MFLICLNTKILVILLQSEFVLVWLSHVQGNRREYLSESEGEDIDGEEVTLPQDLPGAGNVKQHQSAVKLTEVMCPLSICTQYQFAY